MDRNVTNIPNTADCYYIIDDQTIVTETGDTLAQYKLISDTYALTGVGYGVTETTFCYTYNDIKTLPSPFDYMTPIYHILAVGILLGMLFLAFKMFIYPFFRKK